MGFAGMFLRIAGVLLVLGGAGAQESGGDLCYLEIVVYRVQGDVSGETSLTDDIGAGLGPRPKGTLETGGAAAAFFTRARLDVAGVELAAREEGWTWDGGPSLPTEGKDPVAQVAAPAVSARLGQPFTIAVYSDIEYFVRRDDGLFELRSEKGAGLEVSARFEDGPGERIVLRDFEVKLRTVGEREPLEGVTLNVGKPRVEEQTLAATTVSLKPDAYYGLQMLSTHEGVLFARLRLERVENAAAKE